MDYANKLMKTARCKYYSDFISENSSDQRKLFKAAKSLLSEPSSLVLPVGMDASALANNIGEFFIKKVDDIKSSLGELSSAPSL